MYCTYYAYAVILNGFFLFFFTLLLLLVKTIYQYTGNTAIGDRLRDILQK